MRVCVCVRERERQRKRETERERVRVVDERLRERGRRGELYKNSHNYTRNHEYYTRKNIAHAHTHTHTVHNNTTTITLPEGHFGRWVA